MPATYWQTIIRYNGNSSLSFAADSLAEATQRAFSEMVRLKRADPSYFPTVEMIETCAVCDNWALVPDNIGNRRLTCTECSGNPPTFTLGPVQLLLPEDLEPKPAKPPRPRLELFLRMRQALADLATCGTQEHDDDYSRTCDSNDPQGCALCAARQLLAETGAYDTQRATATRGT